jgi:hypothetical protein
MRVDRLAAWLVLSCAWIPAARADGTIQAAGVVVTVRTP